VPYLFQMTSDRRNIQAGKTPMLWLLGLSQYLIIGVVAAQVENMSGEKLQQYGPDAYWEVAVQCQGISSEITIRQKTDENTWCAKNGNSPCTSSKQELAAQICAAADQNRAQSGQSRPQTAVPAVATSNPQVDQAARERANRAAAQEQLKRRQQAEEERARQVAKAAADAAALNRAREQARIQEETRAQERASAAAKIKEDERQLQQEREALNSERSELQQLEQQLEARAKEIAEQLESLN